MVACELPRLPRSRRRRSDHLLLPTLGSPCPPVKDHRIEFTMMQLPGDSGITLMQYSPWVWHVSRDGKHVGTISGDRLGGFTARDIHFESIGRGYVSAEAAVEAWDLVTDRHL